MGALSVILSLGSLPQKAVLRARSPRKHPSHAHWDGISLPGFDRSDPRVYHLGPSTFGYGASRTLTSEAARASRTACNTSDAPCRLRVLRGFPSRLPMVSSLYPRVATKLVAQSHMPLRPVAGRGLWYIQVTAPEWRAMGKSTGSRLGSVPSAVLRRLSPCRSREYF